MDTNFLRPTDLLEGTANGRMQQGQATAARLLDELRTALLCLREVKFLLALATCKLLHTLHAAASVDRNENWWGMGMASS